MCDFFIFSYQVKHHLLFSWIFLDIFGLLKKYIYLFLIAVVIIGPEKHIINFWPYWATVTHTDTQTYTHTQTEYNTQL